jgi:hypothetical protein
MRVAHVIGDPRFTVISEAQRLNEEYGDGAAAFFDPVKRLAILASLRGFRLEAMDPDNRDQIRNVAGVTGRIDAIPAPFQREGAHSERPDVLFLWWQ